MLFGDCLTSEMFETWPAQNVVRGNLNLCLPQKKYQYLPTELSKSLKLGSFDVESKEPTLKCVISKKKKKSSGNRVQSFTAASEKECQRSLI